MKKAYGKVFANIVPRCSKAELLPIIQGKIPKDSTIHTEGQKAYNRLIVNGYNYDRVFYHKNKFVKGKSHVNGIKSFWNFAKRRPAKFIGLTDKKFILHLKKCEYRFNLRDKSFPKFLLKLYFKNKK